jgi:hypothetical protein
MSRGLFNVTSTHTIIHLAMDAGRIKRPLGVTGTSLTSVVSPSAFFARTSTLSKFDSLPVSIAVS